jgi:hypothetical protein
LKQASDRETKCGTARILRKISVPSKLCRHREVVCNFRLLFATCGLPQNEPNAAKTLSSGTCVHYRGSRTQSTAVAYIISKSHKQCNGGVSVTVTSLCCSVRRAELVFQTIKVQGTKRVGTRVHYCVNIERRPHTWTYPRYCCAGGKLFIFESAAHLSLEWNR